MATLGASRHSKPAVRFLDMVAPYDLRQQDVLA
jgi:hypothetical protein